MFEPGQKVVCIDDKFPDGIRDIMNALPVAGSSYTIRDLVPGVAWNLAEEPAVYLCELVNLPNRHNIEPGFACRRFVELEEFVEHSEEEESKELIHTL